jgi:hypothetical protein
MELEQSALMMEVEQVVNDGAKPVHFTVRADLLVLTTGEYVQPLKVTSIDLMRNYLDSYSDELIVEMQIPMGVYAHSVYPYKNAIDVMLTYTPLKEMGDTTDQQSVIKTELFTGTLIDKGSPLLEQNGFNAPSRMNLDLTDVATVHFQCVNKGVEQMRMMSVGQIFRNTTVDDAIKTILTWASQKTNVNGQRQVQGVTMVKSANPKPREHIVIPHGTKLMDVPQYIQKHCGGVYNSSMGYYVQGNQWYVYPALDTTRFYSETSTLTIINIPKNKYPHIERTYRQSAGNLVVLATGHTKFRDPSNQHQLNFGNGIRFADASKFMGGFVKLLMNTALASRGGNNNEFVATKRPNGNNNVHLAPQPITTNSLEQYSHLSRAMGSTISLEWQNSNPDLITPGKPCQILYLDTDQIKTLTGVVASAHHYTHMQGQGMTATRHVTNSILNIFVQPQDLSNQPNSTP